MSGLVEFIRDNSRILLSVLILLLIIAGIAALKKIISRQQRRKELSQAAEDRVRDENLNQVILNQYAGEKRLKEVYKPYDVDYSNAGGGNDRGNKGRASGEEHPVMVQLIERTELSTRKFMMNPVKAIRVGSDIQDNDINVLAESISPHQFEIFAIRNKVFIRNLSRENRTVVRRKKEQVIVDEKGIRLLSGDRILLGCVSYDITITD